VGAVFVFSSAAEAGAQQAGRSSSLGAVAAAHAELLPDAWGRAGARYRQQLDLELDIPQGWTLLLRSDLRARPGAGRPDLLDLWRVSAERRGRGLSLSLGRTALSELRGRLHLDGAAIDLDSGGPLAFRTWAGRLWHPDSPDGALPLLPAMPGAARDAPDPVSATLLLGAELRLRPWAARRSGSPGEGRPGPGFLLAGAESRFFRGEPLLRLWGGGVAHDLRGGSVEGLAELGIPALPATERPQGRALLRVRGPLSRRLDLGGQLRWEDLAPASLPIGVDAPLRRLEQPGGPYFLGEGLVALRFTRSDLTLSLGPALHAPSESGANVRSAPRTDAGGRATASLALRPLPGLAASAWCGGAFLGSSTWVGCGGGAAGNRGVLSVRGDGAVLHLLPVDQRAAWIFELRARVGWRLPLPAAEGRGAAVRLVADAAAGADRLLLPWLRMGVGVLGEFASAPSAAVPPRETP
jgi:hypothetical protein